MKRTLTQKAALISALAMLATTMTACGGGTAEETTVETTTATMKEEQAAVVEQVEIEDEKLENGTLRWLSFWDINPTEGKPVPVSLQLFQTKYGGTVEYIPTTWENRYNDLATMVLGGESPDMFSACDLDLFPGKVAAGMFDPL
ncbi:MAG: carbohydrate ABC transporter substrate-binding protein, partial [Oscillospiraceae bacterium]|nr:carbohydrate ABC transporter substrate-binding protein [Oscillospiraceae bacterium]